MKTGSFNIHDYLKKIHDQADESKYSQINEQDEGGNLPDDRGFVIPEENKKAYDWLKGEYQHGQTEVRVEMTSSDFKPGYHLEDAPESTKGFPGMYGDGFKSGEGKGEMKEKEVTLPKTEFPTIAGHTKSGKTKPIESNKDEERAEEKEHKGPKEKQKPVGIKVDAKTKDDVVKKKNESSEKTKKTEKKKISEKDEDC